MRLQMRRIDHQRFISADLIGPFEKHPGENILIGDVLGFVAVLIVAMLSFRLLRNSVKIYERLMRLYR